MDDGHSPRHDEFRKTLRTRHGVIIPLANISPTVSIGIGLGFLAAVAGTSLPAAFLLAALPILAVSGGYARLAARDPNCGTAYVWVRRALGPWTDYLTGWTAVATNIMFLSYAGQLTGQFTLQLTYEARRAGPRPCLGARGQRRPDHRGRQRPRDPGAHRSPHRSHRSGRAVRAPRVHRRARAPGDRRHRDARLRPVGRAGRGRLPRNHPRVRGRAS